MEKEKSIFQNYIFNLIKTLNGILFPIITFTYAARILGVDGVGKVNFAKSLITYFTMIAMLGMNYYGTREAAKLRGDKERLSRFCVEMLIINGCTTLLAYILLAIAIVFVPRLSGYRTLLLVCSGAIALQGMGMEWLYQAMEEYRYIAARSMLFQIGALIGMFIFVRKESDVTAYALITLFASSGSYVLNFVNARKYIYIGRRPRYGIRRHLKPLLRLFAMAVSIELYTVLDTTMLGLLKGDAAVGLYTAAIKIERVVNTLITAISIVLIPRLSYYINQGEDKKVKDLVTKAYNYVFMLSIPAAAGLFMLSNDIIMLLSGNEFAAAAVTMRILTPIVIFIPFSISTNQQIFVPMKQEKLILLSTFAGAITNFVLNMILIPRYAENGAAIATVIAEFAVALVCYIHVSRYFDMKEIFRRFYQYLLSAVCIPIICIAVERSGLHYVITMLVACVLSMGGYFAGLMLLKNPYFLSAIGAAVGIVRKK